ncbi:CHAD domain-containing protein [Pseudomonas alabamensis]|uniref:CHAD domain-containing protein n=1 Tax=Pseudomonas alabamensis TaxID=3064349 RepID=UPI00119D817D
MSAMLDHVVARVLALHVRLHACRQRLRADTDSEALHDLRTSVRRLRSLLRPLRGLPGVQELEDAARALGTLTTPLRDQEVMGAELIERGHLSAGQRRLEGRAQTFASVADSAPLTRTLSILDAFPGFLRAADREGVVSGLHSQVDERLRKQWRKLEKAVQDPAHDRHRVRLLIKRVRYAEEAYPQLDHAGNALRRLLKQGQQDLGEWHDRVQWLLQVDQQADLAVLKADWQQELEAAQQRADKTLMRLGKALKKR